MNLHINPVTVQYIKDIVLFIMVIGATIYNIIQDRRIQAMEDDIYEMLAQSRKANWDIAEEFAGALDELCEARFDDMEDYCDLCERVTNLEKDYDNLTRKGKK